MVFNINKGARAGARGRAAVRGFARSYGCKHDEGDAGGGGIVNAKVGCAASDAGVGPGERRRIWQVDARMHCSILGTCLALGDLYAIARRARYELAPTATAYHVHSWFVDQMPYRNDLSKLADKELERRHQKTAKSILRARSVEELDAQWREVTAAGHIASAYWAAMSHPLCSLEHQWRLFGEVHMLSHLVGASRRADLCRVHELEVASVAMDSKLAQLKHDHRAALKDRRSIDDELASRRRELQRSEQRLVTAHARIAALESGTLTSEVEARNKELLRLLKEAQDRAAAADAGLDETRAALDEARRIEVLAREHARELAAENEALEAELARSVAYPPVDGEQGDDVVGDLCGRKILCVGGRSNLVQFYRALVERRGGEFLHHDGGVEDSLDAVTRALTTVDAVFCPVDCVSHAACLKVKKACKHLSKDFIVLRSSGLSSFARGLQALVRREVAPGSEPGRSSMTG